MRIFAGRLSSEFWQRVIKHVASMEDTCSLAVVNKYFYKLVNMDFKKLCYDHVLYRLKGETWAYAFSNFGTRVCSDTVGRMVCCPFTGKMVIKLKHSTYVLLTNLDFGLMEFTLIDFRSYVHEIYDISMINRGKLLVIHSNSSNVIYDLQLMKVISDCEQNRKYYNNEQIGSVFDSYSQKEFKLEANTSSGVIIYHLNPFDNCKYVAVHTADNKLVIIDSETDERYEICKMTRPKCIMVNSEHSFVVFQSILGTNVGFRIYSIKRRKFVFESEDLRWHMLNSVTIFHSVTKSFLVYNKQTDNWIEVKTYPEQLKLITPKNYLCGSRMRAKKVMEIYLNENNNRIYKHIFYRFDKDKIRVKTFDFESRDNHVNFHIWNLSKMTFPILKNREGDFYNCFTNLHIADEKVAVIYGRTGAMENYKFKLFI